MGGGLVVTPSCRLTSIHMSISLHLHAGEWRHLLIPAATDKPELTHPHCAVPSTSLATWVNITCIMRHIRQQKLNDWLM